MSEAIQAPRGTRDLLPGQLARWQSVEAALRQVFRSYGYAELRTPFFEHTELFARGIGEVTDIVGKEMYSFLDRKGRSLTLRPEGTAGVVRSYVEHSLGQGERGEAKLFYLGAMFRYERPQAGRYRQFWQAGAEAIGYGDPAVDAESIAMLIHCLKACGLQGLGVDINSVGCPACRPPYLARLKQFLLDWKGAMSAESRVRLETNTLRVLDSKDPADAELIAAAPKGTNHLCTGCSSHFAKVQRHLDRLGVPFEVNKKLVRGFDYYTRTAFEVLSSDLGAQSAVAGGGRYDGLVGMFLGKERPAVGWAIGLDRLVSLLEAKEPLAPLAMDIAVIGLGEKGFGAAFDLAQRLRDAGAAVSFDAGRLRSMKAQFKQASAEGCRLAVILGEDELARGVASVKDMASQTQTDAPLAGLEAGLLERLRK